MSDLEINELISAIALTGDRQSFKTLYLHYYNRLFCLAKSIVKTAEDAEEIVDDTFLSLWARRTELTQINNFPIYTFTAVRNKSLTRLAKQKQCEHLSIDDVDVQLTSLIPSGEDKLYFNDTNRNLTQAINKLSPQCKLVFKLVKEDGFKYREVSEMLNVSVKTVEYHMGNALKKIWEQLSEQPEATSGKKISTF